MLKVNNKNNVIHASHEHIWTNAQKLDFGPKSASLTPFWVQSEFSVQTQNGQLLKPLCLSSGISSKIIDFEKTSGVDFGPKKDLSPIRIFFKYSSIFRHI